MKGDFSRFTFNKDKHYRKVNLQQGRVLVDADWNEQIDIQDYHDTSTLQDIIGQSGGPIENAGFSIESNGVVGIDSLSIGKGHYYIDGVFIENENDGVKISQQKDYPWFKKDGTPLELAPRVAPGIYIVYLDVWERHIIALDDDEIRESALNGADTATRSKVLWQVKLHMINEHETPEPPPIPGDVGYDWNILADNSIPVLEIGRHPIAITQNQMNNNLVIFGIDLTTKGRVYFAIQDAGKPERWLPWRELFDSENDGDKQFSNVAAGINKFGLVELFGIESKEKKIYHTFQQSGDSLENWHEWHLLYEDDDNQFSDVAVGKNDEGLLEVFGIGLESEKKFVYHTARNPDDGQWRNWLTLEPDPKKEFSDIAVGKSKKGNLVVTGIGLDDSHFYYMDQKGFDFDSWSGKWKGLKVESLQIPLDRITVGNNQNGNLEVFGIGSRDKQVYHHTFPGSSGWTVLKSSGQVQFKQIAAGTNQSGCIEVYGVGLKDGHGIVYRNVQPEKNANAEKWRTAWEIVNKPFESDLVEVAFSTLENHLEVFGIGFADKKVYHLIKIKPVPKELDCNMSIPSWENTIKPSAVTMQARVKKGDPSKDPCTVPSEGGGYRRVENQLYRVEIHNAADGEEGASFKYSRDNGAISTRIDKISGNELTVTNSGRDRILGFASGQWVEIMDDYRDLYGIPGTMVKLKGDITEYKLTLDPDTVNGDEITNENFPQEFHPKVRRWDSVDGISKVKIPFENDGYLLLEDGIEIKFGGEGRYSTGDYWIIPARTNKGNIEWPRREDGEPEPLLSKGIEHHYSKIAMVEYVEGSPPTIKDCRHLFSPLTGISSLNTVNTGIITLEINSEASVLISTPVNHGLQQIDSPPAIILGLNNQTNEKLVDYMEDHGPYSLNNTKFSLFKPVDIDLKTFKIKLEKVIFGGPEKIQLRFWAIPAKEIAPQTGRF